MAAFQRAIDLGYRYLETDAHATADGVVVAFHDRTLDRVTDRTGAIARLPYAEVAKARIRGTEPIPRLEDVLTAWPDARVNIDLKDAPVIGPLAEVLHRTGAWDRVCITSFSTRRLAQMRARLPLFDAENVCMALGPRGLMALRARSYGGPTAKLVRLAATGIACAQVPYGLGPVPFVTESFIAEAHRLGLKVHAWTVNDPAAMNRLLDIGIDGMDDEEAAPILRTLFEHQARPEFVYRHRWSQGMLVVWDNRCVTHAATGGYEGHRRLLHRITVADRTLRA